MTADNQTPKMRISAVLTGLLVLAVMAVALAGEFEWINHDLAKRGVGASLGLILLVLGNQMPKLILPPAAWREQPAPILAAERFAATVLVCAGLAATAVWIWWPADTMMALASLIILAGFALAAANWARVLLLGGAPVRRGSDGLLTTGPRLMLLMLMHAVFWVAVIFLADSIWGDFVSRWLAVPAMIFNGVLAVIYARRSRGQA
jgi:hypothetical protein